MKLSGKILMAAIVFLIAALFVAHDANSATPNKQAVVGYAYTTDCVVAGQPAEITYVLTNQSAARRTAIVWHYGIASDQPDPEPMKGGPVIDVDTARSGLFPTTLSYLWYWRVTLKPNETITKSVFVKSVPEPYVSPEPWDPAWGPKPVPRFYWGSTVNVKSTTIVFYPNVNPTYC